MKVKQLIEFLSKMSPEDLVHMRINSYDEPGKMIVVGLQTVRNMKGTLYGYHTATREYERIIDQSVVELTGEFRGSLS